MPKAFEVETQEKEQPLILLFGENPLIPPLIKAYKKDFKLILVAKSSDFIGNSKNLYQINPFSSHLVLKLKEEIDYAVLFLEKQDIKINLANFLSKFEQDKTRVVCIIPINSLNGFYDLILDLKKKNNIFFLILGDLFGKDEKNIHSSVSEIIEKAFETKIIKLSGNELSPIFPISVGDTIKGINQVLFGTSKSKLYYLFYEHPQTLISAVHLLKRVEPELEIRIEEEKIIEQEQSPSHEKVEQQIKTKLQIKPEFLNGNLLGFERSVNELFEKQEKVKYDEKTKYKKGLVQKGVETLNQRLTVPFITTALAFLLFIVINLSFVLSAFIFTRRAVLALENGEYNKMLSLGKTAKVFFDLSQPNVAALERITPKLLNSLELNLLDDFLKNTKLFTLSLTFDEKDGIREERLIHAISSIVSFYFKGEELKAETKNSTVLTRLVNPKNSKLISLLQVLPEVLGFKKEMKYLVLFQNNGELRPTGGFIGSIGELSLVSGKIKDFKILDVYDLDGLLKAHVEPHYIVRRYLQPHLYLRDSNFSLDFGKTASYSALLYNLETKKQVDGIIAIDYEILRRIIEKIGPLTIREYNKTLNKDNTFEFIQKTIETDFFPGSTQKKDLLTDILNQLTITVQGDKEKLYTVLSLIPDLLEEKHILFAFRSNSIQPIFTVSGFSGSYQDPREKPETIYDFLSVNEANIGVNKANVYVKRHVGYDVIISDKEINSKVTLTLTNKGDKPVDYKVYIRVVTPIGSTLSSIKIGGQEQKVVQAVTDYRDYEKKGFKPPVGLEVDNLIEGNHQTFGFITTVPKGEGLLIEVSYRNGVTSNFSNILDYSLLYIKQPGTNDYPLKIRFQYPEDFVPQGVENASFEKEMIVIDKRIKTDKEFKVKLLKGK